MRESVSFRGGYDFDYLQNGVIGQGDLLISGISVDASTGKVSFTLAAATGVWVKDSSGAMIRSAPSRVSDTLSPPTLPSVSEYLVVGVEMDAQNNLYLVAGAETSTALDTGLLIAQNSPAVSAGRIRVADISITQVSSTGYELTGASGGGTSSALQGVNWLDRRPWALGAMGAARGSKAGEYSTSSSVYVDVDSVNLRFRLECSGVPLRMGFSCAVANSVTGAGIFVGIIIDEGNTTNPDFIRYGGVPQEYYYLPISSTMIYVPQPGSHLFSLAWFCNQTASMDNYAQGFPSMWAAEDIRANSFPAGDIIAGVYNGIS